MSKKTVYIQMDWSKPRNEKSTNYIKRYLNMVAVELEELNKRIGKLEKPAKAVVSQKPPKKTQEELKKRITELVYAVHECKYDPDRAVEVIMLYINEKER